MVIRAVLGWLTTDASGSKQRPTPTASGPRLTLLFGTWPSPVRPKQTAAGTASVCFTSPKTVHLLVAQPPANLTSHSLCHIVNDTSVDSGTSNLAKGVPSRTVAMNTSATIMHITFQLLMSIIRLYIAQAILASNLPLANVLNRYSHVHDYYAIGDTVDQLLYHFKVTMISC